MAELQTKLGYPLQWALEGIVQGDTISFYGDVVFTFVKNKTAPREVEIGETKEDTLVNLVLALANEIELTSKQDGSR